MPLDPIDRLKLFGTAEPADEPQMLSNGALTASIVNGAVAALHWNGVEVLRGLSYPVRNEDWGTYPTTTLSETLSTNPSRYERKFTVGEDRFEGRFVCEAHDANIFVATLTLRALKTTSVGRAGLVVLHPITGLAGTALQVTHPDGGSEATRFPAAISPSQPVFDIAALRQSAEGVTAEIAFAGEVFEMEDQRNWSDASYKTYCRPLGRPYPYEIAAGDVVEQSVTVRLSVATGAVVAAPRAISPLAAAATVGRLPSIGLAFQPGWEAPADDGAMRSLAPAFSLIRVETDQGGVPDATLARLLGAARGALALEMVTSDEVANLAGELSGLARQLAALGAEPSYVTASPRAYLLSYQPTATWPAGARPEDAAAAARAAFPRAKIGGGVLTNFTELNRYRGAAAAGDFVTHGTTAIVHAADDVSVMQTLEALAQIYASAQVVAPSKPYRLGLSTIGMRSNPYGIAIALNPSQVRRPMAGADPRQRGLFGAAFMLGVAVAGARAGAEAIALAAATGPLGLVASPTDWPQPLYDDDPQRVVFPAYHVFRALTTSSDWHAVDSGRALAAVRTASASIVANLTAQAVELDFGGRARVLLLDTASFDAATRDPAWLDHAARTAVSRIALGPYATAFMEHEQ